jgi:DNA-directed RNA polymerase I, II, and III subunit RPABC5
MIIPVRCFTCGKVVGNKYITYTTKLQEGIPAAQVLNELGLTRYCCRSMLLTHVEILDKMLLSHKQANTPKQPMQIE